MKPRLVIAGASGTIGQHLIQTATSFEVLTLTRQNTPGTQVIRWNPQAAQQKDQTSLHNLAKALDGAKAIVNLAGSSIADGRLDKVHQEKILESRLNSTATLIAALQLCQQPPEIFFQASAVGYYGNRNDETLLETSAPQPNNILSEICLSWENAAKPIQDISRLVTGRFGLIIAKDAPAWKKMTLPIKLFVGGPLGNGQQWYPWIDASDAARAILFLIENSSSEGVYNITAPNPIRQKDLVKKTAHYLGRPSIFPAPAFALRILLGGVADALLLSSNRVLPQRLEQAGFKFETHYLEQGLHKWF
jgi:uncharacterized protein (TIGR01777 family)